MCLSTVDGGSDHHDDNSADGFARKPDAGQEAVKQLAAQNLS
jgi:hypothetical protein